MMVERTILKREKSKYAATALATGDGFKTG
jgi:hypothetical protein